MPGQTASQGVDPALIARHNGSFSLTPSGEEGMPVSGMKSPGGGLGLAGEVACQRLRGSLALPGLARNFFQQRRRRLVTLRGGGGKTAARFRHLSKHLVKNAEIVMRQKRAGAAHAFACFRLAQRKASLKTLLYLWQFGNILGWIAPNQIHEK